ncbi:MAG: ABC transporter ATP-binding protein, partial [Bacteroidales bacterium]|nr:ABC transporter ATP-binding protein [Bacteroidales bacterium]
MIRLENLRLGYGQRLLLDDASATLPAGSLTALLGRNGSGKSTLLRALIGQEKLQGGRIRLNGQPLSEISPERLARTVAFVNTARVRVADLRCKDVVALGRAPYTNWIGRMQAQDEAAVREALAMTGMAAYA